MLRGMWWEELRWDGKARTAEVEALEFWGMIWQNTTLILHLLFIASPHWHSRPMCPSNPCQSMSTDTEPISLSLSLSVTFSVTLMQPCHYTKCCLASLFVCLIAAECCVSRTSLRILKQSQCGIIRYLTALRADRPRSNATGNCCQLAWLSSNRRTRGPLYKHTNKPF